MSDTLAKRIFAAHLELSLRLGRKVTMAEFGELIGTHMKRASAFSAAAVSRWERGQQTPTPDVIESIAAISGLDPGWISHGLKSAAPQRSGEFPKYTPGASRPVVLPGASVEAPALGSTPAEAGPRGTGDELPLSGEMPIELPPVEEPPQVE